MSPQLRQINVTYVDVEDRLLLKVSTSADEEYRVWCTRRFTRLLLDHIEQSFQEEMFREREEGTTEALEPAKVPDEARREVAKMQHQQVVSEDSFSKPYEAEPDSYPLGEDGLLATTLKFKQKEDGGLQLHLGDRDGRGITLNLNDHLKHQTYELFSRGAERGDWFGASASVPVAGVVH